MSKPQLAHRIYSDPAYAELVRTVGYAGAPYPHGQNELERLNAKYGNDKMRKATQDLIAHDEATDRVILRPGVRKRCFGLLGPAPEDEDWYYRHPDGTPRERPKLVVTTGSDADQHGQTAIDLPQLASSPKRQRRRQANRPQQSQAAPTRSPNEPAITELPGAELMQRYFAAKRTLASETAITGVAWEARMEFDRVFAECRRRGFNLPPDGPNPAPMHDAEAERFRQHTTHRLRELLDMAQYEVSRYDPKTVAHQEALRDIGFIQAELQRREGEPTTVE
jgi:hypothetical protein